MKYTHKWTLLITAALFGFFLMGLAPSQPKNQPKADSKSKASKKAEPKDDETTGAQPEEKAEFVGEKACLDCHEGHYGAGWEKKPHGRFLMDAKRDNTGKGCEDCHGPGSLHLADPPGHILNPAKMKPRASNEMCLKCHNDKVKSHEWQISEHALGKVRCVDCHKQHIPTVNTLGFLKTQSDMCLDCHRDVQSQLHQNSHHPVREGKVACSECHNIHSGAHEHMLISDEKSLCTRCHGDVSGPFVYEHDPLVNGYSEPCTSCHRAHGSPNTRLMKFAGRGACLQCHTTQAFGHYPGTCWNCHTHIHGSNTDPNLLQ